MLTQLQIQRGSQVPLYRQLVDQLRTRIRNQVLAPGERLPPVRRMAADLQLTRLTVHAAYAELQAEGLVESFIGRGTFVSPFPSPAAAPTPALPAPLTASWEIQGLLAQLIGTPGDKLLSFAQAHPAGETIPTRELGASLQRALADPALLNYGVIQGEPALREQLSRVLLSRGVSVSPDHVLITAGAQQGISLALRALTAPEDVVLVEEPTYPGMLEAAAMRGQRLVGIPVDADGISLPELEAACNAYHPRLLYMIPTYHNPTGTCLHPRRHAAILRIARTHQMLIVEDDVYGLLNLDAPAPPALKRSDTSDQIIYITSFSKILAPGLRLGALVASPAHLPKLAACKQSWDLISSSLLQEALADYLKRGHLPAHLERARAIYRERRDAMREALQRFLPACTWTTPSGGFNVWVTLPERISEQDFVREARERGVSVAPGRLFFPESRQTGYLRLSFGAQPPNRIKEGISRLGQVLNDQLRRHQEAVIRIGRDGGPLV